MKTRLVVIIVLLLSLAIALAGGLALMWRFFVFLLALLALSYLWTRLSSGSLYARVKYTAGNYKVEAGETINQEFTVVSDRTLPTPIIEFEEITDLPGYSNQASFSLGFEGKRTWRTAAVCRRRGVYHLGSFTIRVTDPLGIFSVTRPHGEPREVLVYPGTVDLPFFEAIPLQEPGANPRRWMASEAGPSASRVRDYHTGDSLRRISWQTTAHTGKLMVKEFDPDRSNNALKNLWIVLDMQRESHVGEGDDTTEENAVTLAASLAKKYLDSSKQVGLIASAEKPYLFPPARGQEHYENLMKALALMKATGGVDIETLLSWESERFAADSAIIVIMPSRDRSIAAPLRRVIQRGNVVSAILLDAASYGGDAEAIPLARRLTLSGIHVYVVRRGIELSQALDNRLIASMM